MRSLMSQWTLLQRRSGPRCRSEKRNHANVKAKVKFAQCDWTELNISTFFAPHVRQQPHTHNQLVCCVCSASMTSPGASQPLLQAAGLCSPEVERAAPARASRKGVRKSGAPARVHRCCEGCCAYCMPCACAVQFAEEAHAGEGEAKADEASGVTRGALEPTHAQPTLLCPHSCRVWGMRMRMRMRRGRPQLCSVIRGVVTTGAVGAGQVPPAAAA